LSGTRRTLIAGLDDAGRGSIIGPLLIAGVSVDDQGLRRLSEIGAKDSKTLSPASRERLYKLIKNIAIKIVFHKLTPAQIDEYVLKGQKYHRLNYLEAITMGKIAAELTADTIYVDASDINPERFGQDVLSAVGRDVEIISSHHADRIYPVVSAASIVAKCERDAAVRKIAEEHGDFGSGYPSDPRTIRFLSNWLSQHGEMPQFSRKSWKTWNKMGVKRLDEF
jgi:ribonuclease HII